ncbi:hypothetical protein ACFQ7W_30750 [Streptomyces niveus]|uniref:hypothetical protein n=1 Tax=Streptomyces niveus TaxID=193462 RepID=UPI00369EF8E4
MAGFLLSRHQNHCGCCTLRPATDSHHDVLADLTGRGQLALAHHAANALGHLATASALRALALAEAMRSDTGACAHELRAAVTDQLQHGVPDSLADQLIVLAAAVRSGLLAGDPDSGELALKIVAQWHDLPGTSAVATAIGNASARGQLSGRTTLNVLAARPETGDDLAVICDTARAELRTGPNLSNSRAKQFAEQWWAPDGRIGAPLHPVADDRRDLAAVTRQQLRSSAPRQHLSELVAYNSFFDCRPSANLMVGRCLYLSASTGSPSASPQGRFPTSRPWPSRASPPSRLSAVQQPGIPNCPGFVRGRRSS